jgi:hypothetical protein
MENLPCELTSVTIVAKIHNLIENGDYNELVEFFEKKLHYCTSSSSLLLWKENGSAGWTACHFAASQIVPTEWWEWITNQAVTTDSWNTTTGTSSTKGNNFLYCKNALGQTVVDIFFRSYIRPVRRKKYDLFCVDDDVCVSLKFAVVINT